VPQPPTLNRTATTARGEPSSTRPIIVARAIRGIADGFVSVLLAQYLSHLGFSGVEIGAIVTGTLLGSAVLTLVTGLRWGHHDPRRVLLGACVLMAGTGLGFATLSRFWPLLVVAVVGTLNPSAGDVSVFLPVEQAALADRTAERARPRRFALYNLAGGLGAALGALASPLPQWLAGRRGWDVATTERLAFAVYLVAAIVAAASYLRLEPALHRAASPTPLRESRGIVLRLAALFSLDSAGGGLAIHAILVLYLDRRFGLEPGAMGATLAAASLLASFSQLVAARLAARIGLVRTMVFTHLPANLFLVLAGIVPSAGAAIALLLLRASLSSMDIPARQSLVMRLVTPAERAAAASVTNVPRSLAAAATPALGGWLLDRSAFGWPLVIAGASKALYDLLLLAQPLDRT
jgi:MFS family permease